MSKQEIERYNFKAKSHICKPQNSHMEYIYEGKKMGLHLAYCVECGKTLRNYSWKERDEELRKENESMLKLIKLY